MLSVVLLQLYRSGSFGSMNKVSRIFWVPFLNEWMDERQNNKWRVGVNTSLRMHPYHITENAIEMNENEKHAAFQKYIRPPISFNFGFKLDNSSNVGSSLIIHIYIIVYICVHTHNCSTLFYRLFDAHAIERWFRPNCDV